MTWACVKCGGPAPDQLAATLDAAVMTGGCGSCGAIRYFRDLTPEQIAEKQAPKASPAGPATSQQPRAPRRRAVARVTDPSTSWEAAASVTGLATNRQAVLSLLTGYGPMTDETIYDRLPEGFMSPSGARTRRAELVDAGLVEDSGEKRLTRSGRRTIVWRVRE
jgi:hypothetical protein